MRYRKILGLLAVAAAVLMAFAGSASATTVTTTTGGAAETPTVHALTEGGHFSISNPITNIECASTFEWKVESHGSGVTAKGNMSKLEFTGCTNGWTVEVNAAGSLEVHWTSGHNGTLTSTGMTISATIHLGVLGTITCRYSTESTDIGTITGGNPGTIHIAASLPFHSGSGSCGTGTSLTTGNYTTTSALYVDGEESPPIALTSPTGTAVAPTVHLTNEGGHISIANAIATIECSSTLESTLEPTGNGAAAGKVSALSFTGCTNAWTVSVEAAGELEINATSGYSGTVTSSGATLIAVRHTIFGTSECRYSTNATHIGTITGGNPATLHIEGSIPFHSGGGLCGTGNSQMNGNYVTTSALYIDK